MARRISRWGLALTVLVLLGSPAAARTSADTPRGWHRLDLYASKLGIGFDATVYVEPGARREGIEGETLHVAVESRYLGRLSIQETWLEPGTGRLLAYRSQRRAKGSSYWNDRIYEEEAIRRERAAPAGRDEWDLEPQRWTNRMHRNEAYPAGVESCPVLTSPISVLLWASRPERLEEVCFLVDDSIWHLDVRPGDLQYVDLPDPIRFPGENEPRSRLLVRPLDIRPVPLEPGRDEREFSLLGLEGPVTLFVERSTGAAVMVRGRLGFAGTVEARLTGIR